MVIDYRYKISVFGDFSDISPKTENMLFFLESFKKYGLIPSIFQELKINNGTPQPITQQRVALISNDSKEQILISSNRIDFDITVADDVKLNQNQRGRINKTICDAYKIILNKFGKKPSRLALNTESFVVNLNDEELRAFLKKYTNPISLYNSTPLDEWNTRLMVRKKSVIGGKEELFNVITILSKAALQKQLDGQIIQTDCISVNVDINTIAENSFQRFVPPDLIDFIKVATEWWDTIIDEMN